MRATFHFHQSHTAVSCDPAIQPAPSVLFRIRQCGSRRIVYPLISAVFVLLSAMCMLPTSKPPTEALWYATNTERSIRSFVEHAHANRISIVAPQGFWLDSLGNVWGQIDPRIIETARANQIKIVPLIMNPGFDQSSFHRVLTTPSAQKRAVGELTALCRDNQFEGIQFDFENIHVSDRDAFTSFSRITADSLHKIGCALSAAVVPRSSEDPGSTPYDEWIYENWRGAYDYKALADVMDFLSLMTYAQHTRRTTPGPIGGYPWVEGAVKYLLALGVAPSKISLGVPTYSHWWYVTHDGKDGARVTGKGVSHGEAIALLTRNKVRLRWDDRQKEAVGAWEEKGINQVLSLSDARSFAARLALREKYKLRGYSAWVLGFEDPQVWNEVDRAR